jgi:TRAP-type C4-dicarboxylate transport system permease small subunit
MQRAADLFRRGCEAMACIVLVVIFAINGLEITLRLFDRSLDWIYEVNLLLSGWLYFLGIVPVYYRGGDVTLRGYERVLAARPRERYRALLELVTAATFALLAWYAWALIELQMPFRSAGMHIPNPLFTAPLLIGLCGLALIGVSRAAAVWRGRSIIVAPIGGH